MALDLPEPVRQALVAWQSTIVAPRSEVLRAVGEASLHVTLCFLGSVRGSGVTRIIAACETVAAGASVGGLAVGQPVWLPRRRPHVLAVAIEDDRGELRSLQERLTGALVRTGAYAPEVRLFFPHVTAARVRSGSRVRPARLDAPDPVEFAGGSVTLLRSHLSRDGSAYEPIHRVALTEG